MNTKILKWLKIFCQITLLLFSAITSNAQTLTYSGGFNITHFNGNTTYNYYEKNDKRYYNGKFEFESYDGDFSVIGKYLNGMKEGYWVHTLKNHQISDYGYDFNINATSCGNFVGGKLDGKWTLTKTLSFSKSDLDFFSGLLYKINDFMIEYGQVSGDETITFDDNMTVYFKNNHFIGKFIYTHYSYNIGKTTTITGQFDKDGYMDSIWTTKYYYNGVLKIQIRKFSKGILLKLYVKDNSTGIVETLYDTTNFAVKFLQNINSSGYAEIDGKYYKLEDGFAMTGGVNFAIGSWYNNGNLISSAYIHEMNLGTFDMSFYPERYIVYDEVKTNYESEQRIIEQQRIAEEQARRRQAVLDSLQKVKVHQEWLAFMDRRRKTNYNLKEKDYFSYAALSFKINEIIEKEITEYADNDLTVIGSITYKTDTLGNKSIDFSNLQFNNVALDSIISPKLRMLNIDNIVENEYKFATYAKVDVNISCQKGNVSFKIIDRHDKNLIKYKSAEPDSYVKSYIERIYSSEDDGKYQISYVKMNENGNKKVDFETISFKKAHHAGIKITTTTIATIILVALYLFYNYK